MMDELIMKCDLQLLNDRICNLSSGLATMAENGSMQVNKAFLTATLNYMEELLGLRREEENRRAQPENKPLVEQEAQENE